MLHLIIGPMFSGKTTLLTSVLKEYSYPLYINHTFDTRGEFFYSHNESLQISPNITCVKMESLLPEFVIPYDVIGIDESQFFGNLKKVVLEWVEVYKKTVYVVGLNGDFQREKFGELLDLVPYCDSIQKMSAKCNCGKSAIFSLRLKHDTSKICIGGSESYHPVCRKCYMEESSKSLQTE